MPELLPYAPGSPEWLAARPVVKLSPYSRTGMIHGAHQAAMRAAVRPGFHPAYARSWLYRRGFARAFLLAKGGQHG